MKKGVRMNKGFDGERGGGWKRGMEMKGWGGGVWDGDEEGWGKKRRGEEGVWMKKGVGMKKARMKRG
jgi:hypothetical protein